MIVAQTEWVVPTEYPDLRSANEIAIDLETRDPNLKETGSGAIADQALHFSIFSTVWSRERAVKP